MELTMSIILIIVTIALTPVILYAGFIIVTVLFGIVMMPVAWMISLIEIMRTRKEMARRKKEFEDTRTKIREDIARVGRSINKN